METTTAGIQQFTTTDKHTGHEVTWNVELTHRMVNVNNGPNPNGWTHMLGVTRQGGRGAIYTVWAKVDNEGNIVRTGQPFRLP